QPHAKKKLEFLEAFSEEELTYMLLDGQVALGDLAIHQPVIMNGIQLYAINRMVPAKTVSTFPLMMKLSENI
ncbi:hypothetical protein GWN42_31115, partial [candidate division KSB1 bacterium]|nr:hypothetical protein [candidate division KSB1 bacterium]